MPLLSQHEANISLMLQPRMRPSHLGLSAGWVPAIAFFATMGCAGAPLWAVLLALLSGDAVMPSSCFLQRSSKLSPLLRGAAAAFVEASLSLHLLLLA